MQIGLHRTTKHQPFVHRIFHPRSAYEFEVPLRTGAMVTLITSGQAAKGEDESVELRNLG